MKLLLPHKAIAALVTSYQEIEADAKEMLVMADRKDYNGFWKSALSIHHAQVTKEPLNFFVVSSGLAKAFGGHRIICNARILDGSKPGKFREACMSYPHRPEINTTRYFSVYATAQVPGKTFGIFKGLTSVQLRLEGLLAIVLQHEMDHARGVYIYERFKKI